MMEFPKRKPTRLKGYDYNTAGAYFVTICVKDRKQLLSKITVGDGVLDVPKNMLTEYGEVVDKYIKQMINFYDNICIDKYVIMPNHIHLLISISDHQSGTSRTPSPTNSVISKLISTLKRFCNKKYDKNIWQRSYHDHIIRDKEDYDMIWQYIDTNVIRWKNDCFYND